MLRKRNEPKCKSCVAAHTAAELARAASNAQQSQLKFTCAQCKENKAISSFSKTQSKRPAPVCLDCLTNEIQSQENGNAPLLIISTTTIHHKRDITEPSVSIELRRYSKMKRLRKRLRAICAEFGAEAPLLAFDRWISRAQLRTCDGARPDPLIPHSKKIDERLVADLCRIDVLTPVAQDIASRMVLESEHAIEALKTDLSEADTSQVIMEWRGSVARISVRGMRRPFVEVSRDHLRKLSILYSSACEEDASDDTFRRRLFCMCLRYEALGCHGYQAAIGPLVFKVLRDYLCVEVECFASPLNSTLRNYCSAFPDVDAPFGSCGSFFSYRPHRGSFEVNPPFEPELMCFAVEHASCLVESAESLNEPLSFAFIVPTWDRLPFHCKLVNSNWLRGKPIFLDAESHGFVDGSQHTKCPKDRLRGSSFGTTVAILQSSRAADLWPVSDKLTEEIVIAFRATQPRACDVALRMARFDGDAVSLLMKRRRKLER